MHLPGLVPRELLGQGRPAVKRRQAELPGLAPRHNQTLGNPVGMVQHACSVLKWDGQSRKSQL